MRYPAFIAALALALGASAQGGVIGFDLAAPTPVLDGKGFGAAGPYEMLRGQVRFAVDPANPHNGRIVDLALAPRDPAGLVEFSADVFILRPVDAARGNGAMLFDVANRGLKALLPLFNRGHFALVPSSAADFGDGFLMQRGYTLAWVGWQWDAPPGRDFLRLYAPIAHGPGGAAISGWVRSDFCPWDRGRTRWPLAHVIGGQIGGTGYPAADPGDPGSVLTVRDDPHGPRTPIPRPNWWLDPHFVHLPAGFDPGRIYEVVYRAVDPRVAGLGFAAVRDFLSDAKYDPRAPAPVRFVYAEGISQTGRFLRHFLYQDFNADERGRQVIDGMIAHVAGAGRGSFNHRFAQPSRDADPMTSIDYPTDLFPFTDKPETDPLTGETAGLLDRARASRTVPKIFLSLTSYEYWSRSASLIHTSPDGRRDATISPDVRIYFFAGLQHFSPPFPPPYGMGELHGREREDPNPVTWLWRAMLDNLDAWVRRGAEPPASRYPHLGDSTLVARAALGFPPIPGVPPAPDVQQAYRLDYGPKWNMGIINFEPPKEGAPFPALVPQTDADGNDLGGVRVPELAVPVATYPGWNLRDPSIGAPTRRTSFLGSYLPFARTEAERAALGDPRLSLAGRYRDRADYLDRYEAAAWALAKARFLLPEDIPAIVDRGAAEWDYAVLPPR